MADRHTGGNAWDPAFPDKLGRKFTHTIVLAFYSGYTWRMRSAEDCALHPARCSEKPTGPEGDGRDPSTAGAPTTAPPSPSTAAACGSPPQPRRRPLRFRPRRRPLGHPQIVGGGAVKPMDEAVAVAVDHDNKPYVMYRR
ncbi:hypothetical protein Snoj_29960 [Streptomyces nojiriensis]|uniref:Uncharacterized protein n=1 Tax=Streptomyces nojiriensis TaxID=66374 RepID=A0ABQ3SLR2_9ACTN|nr:hypothetical protein GCM10010205_52140 [Streptomyces nojiriensis]GHI69078.1 hypothetical protein Snoj_29960 [Streptomyces nojiriensis]